jgi:chemotaxis response regulator CheB
MVMREFLKGVADIEICGEAVDGLDAIEQAKSLNPIWFCLIYQCHG